MISALEGYAVLRRAQGDSKEAEILLGEGWALRSRAYPELKYNPDAAILALTKTDQGKFDEAIKTVRQRIAAIRQQKGNETPELCSNLTGLGSFLLEKGAPAEAEENLRAAETIYRKLYSAANIQLGDNLRLQAQAFLALRQYPEAESKINATLEIYRAASSSQYVNYPTALMVQGNDFSQTGRTAEAENCCAKRSEFALKTCPKHISPSHGQRRARRISDLRRLVFPRRRGSCSPATAAWKSRKPGTVRARSSRPATLVSMKVGGGQMPPTPIGTNFPNVELEKIEKLVDAAATNR